MAFVRSITLLLSRLAIAAKPLNLMQIIAWENMPHDYSSDRFIAEAAEMTFSGEYPCEICICFEEAKSLQIRK
jgi:hypothetical protein